MEPLDLPAGPPAGDPLDVEIEEVERLDPLEKKEPLEKNGEPLEKKERLKCQKFGPEKCMLMTMGEFASLLNDALTCVLQVRRCVPCQWLSLHGRLAGKALGALLQVLGS